MEERLERAIEKVGDLLYKDYNKELHTLYNHLLSHSCDDEDILPIEETPKSLYLLVQKAESL